LFDKFNPISQTLQSWKEVKKALKGQKKLEQRRETEMAGLASNSVTPGSSSAAASKAPPTEPEIPPEILALEMSLYSFSFVSRYCFGPVRGYVRPPKV